MTRTDKDDKQCGHQNELDRMVAYQLLQEKMEKQKSLKKYSGSDGSTLVAIFCTIGGLIVMSVIFCIPGS